MGIKTVLVDDLDGSELPVGTKPVVLSLGAEAYNIYLSSSNHAKLVAAIEPFTKDAERVESPRRMANMRGLTSTNKSDARNVRKWAQETGFKYPGPDGKPKRLGSKGRIPPAVLDGWRSAGSPAMDAD